jgi:hypothetical protein
MLERRVAAGRAGEGGQERDFGQPELLDRLAEEGARRRLDPVRPVPEVDLVEVEL